MNEDRPTEPAADSTPPELARPVSSEGRADTQPGSGNPAEAAADGVDGASPERRKRRRRRRRGQRAEGNGEGVDSAAPEGATEVSADATEAPSADTTAGPGKRRRRRRGKKGERAPEPATASESRPPRERRERPIKGPTQLASIAVRALSNMADRLLDVEGVDLVGRPRHIEVRLKIPLDAARDGARAATQAVEQIVARVRDVREHEAALQPGAVFCYFTGSATAPHSRPPSTRQVFEGYGSTGRPTYAEFVTLAIERRAEAIDRLVAGDDLVVTYVSMGRVLRTQQLHEFGQTSTVFRILGQVDAGLYPLVGSAEKAAFSFQLLRAQTLDGLMRFRLHWVGAADLRDIADPSVLAILKRFQQKLDHESLRYQGLQAHGKTVDDEEFVQPFLAELAKQLAGRARRASHRTEHAMERVEDGQRPTTKCWDDAQEASDERILRDDEQGTLVVVGPKNRVHVFATDARHVTSFVLSGSQVQRRLGEGRWHPSEPEDRGMFRIALRRRIGDGTATTAEETTPDELS